MYRDFDACYRAVQAKDGRFDGVFITGVYSTGIYCRPSCPAITPKRTNVGFFPTAAAAQASGLRACKRCRPDASPGSPEWDIRADLCGRAMRLIADGTGDREGVRGLARRLHISERHLHRLLVQEVGAGPQALARAERAQSARVLIETTDLTFSEIAFASGFASIRQFNETLRKIFEATPSQLRAKRGTATAAAGEIVLRLPHRTPFAAGPLFSFLGDRAVEGLETFDGDTYRRTLRLPYSAGMVSLRALDGSVEARLRLDDVRDLTAAVQRCRRLLDLDADPVAVGSALHDDPLLGPQVRALPGLRVPGAVDGFEVAVRAILGQQISVAGARTLAGRVVAALGTPLASPFEDLTKLFPEADVMAEADLSGLGITGARQRALRTLSSAVADGSVVLDAGADRERTRQALLELPGIGPWTADYIALRALGDPDAFMPTDLGVRQALRAAGVERDPEEYASRWRPWRAYAQQYLWTSLVKESSR
ncbi:MAG: AlkA N-terminal domain-containing protein [Actinomycetota bacterium]